MAGCAAITASQERLACYDAIAGKIAPGARQTSPTVEGSGKWNMRTEMSPVDDSMNVFLRLEAEDTIATRFGQETKPIMIIRCKENETDVLILWENYLGLDDTEVLIRLDKEPAKETRWDLSTDNSATFHRNPIPFIREMLKRETLLARTTPYSENPATTTFDIRGLAAVIGKVQEACHWKG
jgi:type VI secretion system protein VasI